MSRQFAYLMLLIVAVLRGPESLRAEVRVFTSVAGTTLRGELVQVTGQTVTIKKEDGQILTLKAATLSPVDIQYLQAHGLAPPLQKPAVGAAQPAAKQETGSDDRKMLRIIEDVLFPDWNNAGVALRWSGVPELRINSDDPELSKFAQACFDDFCKESGLQPAPGERIIEVNIAPEDKIKKLIAKEKYKPSYRNGSAQNLNWDAKYSLERSVVFISRDKLVGDPAKADLNLWMAASFGLWGYSQELKPEDRSTFSHDFAAVQTMSPLDRKLLAYIYKNIPAGTKKAELRGIFRKTWQP